MADSPKGLTWKRSPPFSSMRSQVAHNVSYSRGDSLSRRFSTSSSRQTTRMRAIGIGLQFDRPHELSALIRSLLGKWLDAREAAADKTATTGPRSKAPEHVQFTIGATACARPKPPRARLRPRTRRARQNARPTVR